MDILKSIATFKQYATFEKVVLRNQPPTQVFVVLEGELELDVYLKDTLVGQLRRTNGSFFGGLLFVRGNEYKIEGKTKGVLTTMEVSLTDLDLYRKSGEEGADAFNSVMQQIHKFYLELKALGDRYEMLQHLFIKDSPYATQFAPEGHKVYLLDKQFKCPVCGLDFKAPSVRGTRLQLEKRGDFFINHYRGIDHLWYEVVLCPSCGYAERVADFDQEVKFNLKKLEGQLETLQANQKIQYSIPRSVEEIVNAYKIYEQCLILKDSPKSALARNQLLQYEFYSRLGDRETAEVYLEEAFDYYKGYFSTGILDVDDLQLQQLYLILGKLYEHKGELKEAKLQYRNAKMIRGVTDTKYIDLADEYLFDLEDLIKAQEAENDDETSQDDN